jgi:uncharacterized protein DUF3179
MHIGARDDIESPRQPGIVVCLGTLLAATMAIAFAPRSATAQAKKLHLPYVTVDHPQFISASQATFLSPKDMLIGVTDGKTTKAYPAAILAQHGVVQDQMADGPIAVTW